MTTGATNEVTTLDVLADLFCAIPMGTSEETVAGNLLRRYVESERGTR
jgi:hypothetical protein